MPNISKAVDKTVGSIDNEEIGTKEAFEATQAAI